MPSAAIQGFEGEKKVLSSLEIYNFKFVWMSENEIKELHLPVFSSCFRNTSTTKIKRSFMKQKNLPFLKDTHFFMVKMLENLQGTFKIKNCGNDKNLKLKTVDIHNEIRWNRWILKIRKYVHDENKKLQKVCLKTFLEIIPRKTLSKILKKMYSTKRSWNFFLRKLYQILETPRTNFLVALSQQLKPLWKLFSPADIFPWIGRSRSLNQKVGCCNVTFLCDDANTTSGWVVIDFLHQQILKSSCISFMKTLWCNSKWKAFNLIFD